MRSPKIRYTTPPAIKRANMAWRTTSEAIRRSFAGQLPAVRCSRVFSAGLQLQLHLGPWWTTGSLGARWQRRQSA